MFEKIGILIIGVILGILGTIIFPWIKTWKKSSED